MGAGVGGWDQYGRTAGWGMRKGWRVTGGLAPIPELSRQSIVADW